MFKFLRRLRDKNPEPIHPELEAVRIYRLTNYRGTCHICNSPQTFDSVLAYKYYEDEQAVYFWPVQPYFCPSCHTILQGMRIFKNLNVTHEFKALTFYEHQ